ncbi:MAG: prepilin peptidase CpaA [Bryobacterales bacterium]|jgi:prepilin peptidase CpaA|nr:prepilin peptidase CpaA [Bryobacterales bacterium]
MGVSAVLITLVLAASIYDMRYRRIPNWLSLTGAVTGIALNSFLYQGWPGLRLSLVGLTVAFSAYFALYSLRAMGAGDVKLMAAIGALTGVRDWFGIFIITALIGGIAGLWLVAMRGRLRKTVWNVGFILSEMKSGRPAYLGNKELDVRSPKSMGLPHGAVIAAGTIVFLGLSARFSE